MEVRSKHGMELEERNQVMVERKNRRTYKWRKIDRKRRKRRKCTSRKEKITGVGRIININGN